MKLLKKHLLGLFHINRNLGRRIGMSTLLGKKNSEVVHQFMYVFLTFMAFVIMT